MEEIIVPVSRRDFFAQLAAKAVENISKIIPANLNNCLGLNENKPLSPEEAAFALAKMRRTNPLKSNNITNQEKCQGHNS
jgi:hypothetical protein